MRILVISQYYKPEPIKLHEVLVELVANGHEVSVVTSVPNYPTGDIYDAYHFFKSYKEELNNVKIYRVPTVPRKRNVFFLILNYLIYALNASIKVLTLGNEFDVVFVYQLSPVTMILPGVLAKKFLRIPLFIYSLDIWPESLKVMNFDERSLVFKLVKKISTALYNQADHISVSSKSFIDYFVGYHKISKDKVDYFPQYTQTENLVLTQIRSNTKQLNIYYFGNIGLAQDFETLLEAMKQIDFDCIVNFVGAGSYLEILGSKILENSLSSKFRFHGVKRYEDLPKYYQEADICFLSLKSNSSVGRTLPNKLLEYMAMGKPVIAVIEGDACEVIHDSNCGLVSIPGDVSQLITNIETMYHDAKLRGLMSQNGFEYYKGHFTLNKHVEKIIYHLHKVIND